MTFERITQFGRSFMPDVPATLTNAYETVQNTVHQLQRKVIPWMPLVQSHSLLGSAVIVTLMTKVAGDELPEDHLEKIECITNCLFQYCQPEVLVFGVPVGPVSSDNPFNVRTDKECLPYVQPCFEKCYGFKFESGMRNDVDVRDTLHANINDPLKQLL